MTAHIDTPPPATAQPATESTEAWLLAVFAVLIIAAIVPIALVIVSPSVFALIAAISTVIAFAAGVAYLLARMIGPE